MLLNDNKGLTLLEILIVLGILGIVTALTLPLNIFGINTNKKIDKASDMQFTTRMAADKIADICRNRDNVSTISSLPPSPGTYKYIYMKNSDNSTIFYYDGSSEKVLAKLASGTLTLTFTPNGKVLNYKIKAQIGTDKYEISSGVELLNMKTDILGSSSNKVSLGS